MKLSEPKMVHDLGSVLPSDGEDSISIQYEDSHLSLNLFHESNDSSGLQVKTTIRFQNASYFVKTPFPGVSLFECPDDRNISLLSSLVEYQKSELLDSARKMSSHIDTKHYRIFLHSVGVALHVIAKTHDVSTEQLPF